MSWRVDTIVYISASMAYKWELEGTIDSSCDVFNKLYTRIIIMLFASSLTLKRAIFPTVTRARRCGIATDARGTNILDKHSDDVVITFAKRTAVGRAKKGQFKDTPVDELLHALFKVWKHLSYSDFSDVKYGNLNPGYSRENAVESIYDRWYMCW